MKVIVENTQVYEKAGTSQKTGKDYLIREQKALIHGDRIRGEVKLLLERDQVPYEPGEYDIDIEKSVYIGKFQSFGFSPVLTRKVQGPRLGAAA